MANRKLSRAATARFVTESVPLLTTCELASLQSVLSNELRRRESLEQKQAKTISISKRNLNAIRVAAHAHLSLHVIGAQNTGKSELMRLYRTIGGQGAVCTSWYCPCGAARSLNDECGCVSYDKLQYVYGWDKFDITIEHDPGKSRRYDVYTISDIVAADADQLSAMKKYKFSDEAKTALYDIGVSRKLTTDALNQLKRVSVAVASFSEAAMVAKDHVTTASELYWDEDQSPML